jgi:hypothetical protein
VSGGGGEGSGNFHVRDSVSVSVTPRGIHSSYPSYPSHPSYVPINRAGFRQAAERQEGAVALQGGYAARTRQQVSLSATVTIKWPTARCHSLALLPLQHRCVACTLMSAYNNRSSVWRVSWIELKGKEVAVATATWGPELTLRSQHVWQEYQRTHNLSSQQGKIAAVDPESERVWIGESGVDIAQQMRAEGIDAPVYLFRVGEGHFLRKGRR